jgi:hypothetical protein
VQLAIGMVQVVTRTMTGSRRRRSGVRVGAIVLVALLGLLT